MDKQDNNKVWIGVEDLNDPTSLLPNSELEFNHDESNDTQETSRRDFLKVMGFGLGAATVASCDIPLKKAIPYVIKPEEIVPGVATYYASSIVSGGDVVPVLVKTREGRPIKIEGNPGMSDKSTFTGGGTSARSQASVLSLYDTNRIKAPMLIEEGLDPALPSWANIDKRVKSMLSADSQVRIVSHTNSSPSFKKAVEQFKSAYPNTNWVQYDPVSYSAMLTANQNMFGMAKAPRYHFDKAKCIVSIDADFLGTWLSPVEFSAAYARNRKIGDKDVKDAANKMSIHIQFESGMSLTGSNADHRVLIKPSEMRSAVALLYKEVCSLTGNTPKASLTTGSFSWNKAEASIKETAKKLVDNTSKSLVVSGVNDLAIQTAINEINALLGSYGSTMALTESMHSNQAAGNDTSLSELAGELKAGTVDAILVCAEANPAYDTGSLAATFAEGISKTKLSVSFALSMNETSSVCNTLTPDLHNLEAWGDVQPVAGQYYLIQPTIAPLFDARSAGESLLAWSGNSSSYADFVQANWKSNFEGEFAIFDSFWNNALHDGYYFAKTNAAPAVSDTTSEDTTEVGQDTNAVLLGLNTKPKSGDLEITFYQTPHLAAGQDANNPWLQEMPDPVMRTSWDNFIQIPIKTDGVKAYESLNDLKDGDMATLTINGQEYTLPVFRQFGQMQGTVSVALGYGRTVAGKCGTNVGTDLFPAVEDFQYYNVGSLSNKVGRADLYANVQLHHTYGITTMGEDGTTKMQTNAAGQTSVYNVDEEELGFQTSLTARSVFFHSSAKDLSKNLDELAKRREGYQYLNSKGLYPEYDEVYKMGHHWGMAVDLNSCTGCGACTVACMAENNVPVVGKREVSRAHEMTWLRIDRYFYGNEETPNTVYMPMMCQHCDNAPCENVCPVAATNHSSEGLNQMTYNRCVGTRYCANNCPFKVRRFNWLDYTSADIFPSNEVDINYGVDGKEEHMYLTDNLTRMVLNPDVTVRTRGVIEKCSFCVQRIQEGKLTAKVEGRKLNDIDVKPACVQSCPTGAIVFGDMNNPESDVSKLKQTQRAYLPLEETNVRSSVSYLMKVTNKQDKLV